MSQKILIVIFVFLSGCATNRNLGPIPTDPAEFKLPIASLKSSYPELETYNRDNVFVGYCTPVNQLKKAWGEPNEIQTVWLQVPIVAVPFAFAGTGGVIAVGIGYSMYPAQPKHYIWRKGDYEIDAYISTEIGCGYEPRLWNWQWKQVTNP